MRHLKVMFVLLVQACSVTPATDNTTISIATRNTEIRSENGEKIPEVSKPLAESIEYYDLRNSIGLIVTDLDRASNAKSLHVYNKDGSLWYNFPFGELDEAQNSDLAATNFQPFRYNSSESMVAMNIIGEDTAFFEVVVNEATGVTKYVRKSDPILRHSTWADYVLDCFAVEFDPRTNPIVEEPNGPGLNRPVEAKPTYFYPQKISGDWLKISWKPTENAASSTQSGWIRWRKNNKIVINLFETA